MRPQFKPDKPFVLADLSSGGNELVRIATLVEGTDHVDAAMRELCKVVELTELPVAKKDASVWKAAPHGVELGVFSRAVVIETIVHDGLCADVGDESDSCDGKAAEPMLGVGVAEDIDQLRRVWHG